jgi:hypothetical protein
MNTTLSGHSFRRLVNSLVRPTETAETGPNYWPYPLPEAEIVACYGPRCLTRIEQQLFPGLRLALNISKVCLTRPPVVTPAARAGWAFGELSRAVVWTAETYPGHYLIRMPGGAMLLAPYNQMAWTAVSEESDDIPVTTLADIKAEAWRQKWRTLVRQNIHRNLRI